MNMGAPEDSTKGVIFRWNTVTTHARMDPSGRPYRWDSTPTASVSNPDVIVDVAVEFSARPAGTRNTPEGQFDTSRAIITVLDVDYELIEGADLAIIDGDEYEILFEGPPVGLFETTIHTLICEARDES